jgi:uncharacterized membrane protein
MAKNLNQEHAKKKGLQDRISDSITEFAGSLRFVYAHTIWFGIWILINIGVITLGVHFDPYPFGLLTLIVSLEAIFLSTFVMISQNRQAEREELRAELDYQTDVKAEQEIAYMKSILEALANEFDFVIEDGKVVKKKK